MIKIITPPPLLISPGDCIAWFDAADVKTITESSNLVSSWTNKNGSNNHATQNGGDIYKPATNIEKINGKNVLTFDGVATFLNLSNIFPDLTNGEYTLFSVGKANSIPSSTRYLFGSSSAQRVQHIVKSSGNFSAVFGATSLTLDTTTLTTSPFVAYSQHKGSTDICFAKANINSSIITTRSYTGQPSSLSIGCNNATPSVSQNWDGVIGEIIIYNKNLIAAEASYIMSYLGQKWGIPL